MARVAVAVVVALIALPAVPSPAASPGIDDHGVIASTVPLKYTPNFGNGAVEAIVQVGSRVIVGGTFTTVTPVTTTGIGAATTRNYLMAFNATTGALDTGFQPKVNGEVDTIVPTADGTGVYVGGRFNSAGGMSLRLALFNLATGALVTTFTPSVNSRINDLALVGQHLLMGGAFTAVGGKVRDGLASVNPTTGAVESYFAVQLTGHHNYGRQPGAVFAPTGAETVAVSPDGRRAIVDGNFIKAADTVNTAGYARDQIVSIDLTTPNASVDAHWNTNVFTPPCFASGFDFYVRDIGWSPDGSYFVVSDTGGYQGGSFEHCDSASRFEASATGTNVQPTWTDYTGTDSLYSVAVTSDAVYVGGHNRWLNNPYGQDKAAAGAVPRPGLAALEPANGVPMSWNPGRNPRGHGAEVVYATPTGIWVGSDTDYIGDYRYKHQKIAFFPFAGGEAAAVNDAGDPGTVFVGGTFANVTTFGANSFNPATGSGGPASPSPSNGGGLNWGRLRGAFVLNGYLWYGLDDGKFYTRTFDGHNSFGPALLVDPYNDPYWSNFQTGSKQTYRGMATSFYAEILNVTGMFYANRSIYYTLANDGRLYRRDFSPAIATSSVATQVTGGVISPVKVTVSDPAAGALVNFSYAGGMFIADGSIWYASRITGKLYRASWNGTTVTSAGSVDTLATGNWAGRGVFVAPS